MRSSEKNVHFQGLAAAAAAGLLLVGCNESSPTAPPMPTPAPPVVSTSTAWSVTQTVTSVSGPDICLLGLPVPGQSEQGEFELRKSGDSVSFIFPFDINSYFLSYTGTATGMTFTASFPGDRPGGLCVSYRATYTLSGRFSEDGSSLTATEVWTWTLDSGQAKTFTFEWSARRR